MRRKSKLFRKVSLLGLVLFTVVSFPQCKKSEVENLSVSAPSISDELSATTTVSSKVYDLNVSAEISDGGYAYQISGITGGDSKNAPTASKLRLFENGVELNPAHSLHTDIRTLGKGRFSHWGSSLIISASDNTDPKKNGRKYTYTLDGGVPAAPVVLSPTTTSYTLNVASGISDGGYAYQISGIAGGDSNTAPTASKLRLFENGVELNPAHSLHSDIRTLGKGRFSHWGNSLIISASDNTDPRKNGRKYTYTLDGSTPTTTTTSPAPAPAPAPATIAPTVSVATPIGYAMVDGKTTGGLGGQTITVSTLADLKNAAASSSPMIIKVSGNITGSGSDRIWVKSNKSIIGINGAKITGAGFSIYAVSNIIIQNLTINYVVGGDCITIKEAAHHIWVDHCEFYDDKNHGWDYYDGLLDITEQSDYVTVSWNKFHDSNIALLIGGADDSYSDKGHLRVTLYNNYFYNNTERQPRTRFGSVHCFNNYIKGGSYAIAAQAGATVRTDNNYIENVSTALRTDISSSTGYFSGTSTNIFKNSGASRITTAESTWVPTYEYKSSLIPAADVPAKIIAGAGATL